MRIFSVRIVLWAAIPAYALVALGYARLPRGVGLLPLGALLAMQAQNAVAYYDREPRPAWQSITRELVAQTDPDSRILGGEAHRWTTYYWERHTAPIEARTLTRVRHLRRDLEKAKAAGQGNGKLTVRVLSDDRDRVWVIGQTWHRDFKDAVRKLRRDPSYRLAFRHVDGSAALFRFERDG
jgi:hypothetical protein